MSIVYDLVYDFVDKHKVLANAFLIKHSAEVSEYLHHAIEDVHHIRWRYILLGSRYEVDAELFRVKVVDSVHILQSLRRRRSLRSMEEGLLART